MRLREGRFANHPLLENLGDASSQWWDDFGPEVALGVLNSAPAYSLTISHPPA